MAKIKSDPAARAAIGARLKRVREAWGLNQTEFARGIGAEPNSVSEWESGKKDLGLPTALKLKRKYGASLDYLYDDEHGSLPLDLAIAIMHSKTLSKRIT